MHRNFLVLLVFNLALILVSCDKQDPVRIDETITLRYAGADMPAYVHGNPESEVFLILLHGAGSFGLSFRDGSIKEDLENKYVLIYFDQRGQSMSQGHYTIQDDKLSQMADDVNALVHVLKTKYGEDKHYFLLGHSLGSAIASLALLRNNLQEEIDGWISVNGALDFPRIAIERKTALLEVAQEQIALGNSPGQWADLAETIKDLDPMEEDDYRVLVSLVRTATNLLVKDGLVPGLHSSELLFNTLVANNPVSWQVSNLFNKPVKQAVSEGFTVTDRLHELSLPALFIFGKYDFSVPASQAQTVFPELGTEEKQLFIFEESMHHTYETESELFAMLVSSFIEETLY